MPASKFVTEQQTALIHYRLRTVKKVDDPGKWLEDFVKKPEHKIFVDKGMLTVAGAKFMLETILKRPLQDWEK